MRNIAFGTEQIMQGTGMLKKTRLFALILIQHRIWGMILMPYIIQKEAGRSYHRLAECLSPFPASETMGTLAPEERDLVNIINEYNERALFKLFSKDRSVKEFIANIIEDKLERHIRPYIERRLFKCFQISGEENIPVYFQKTKSAAIHSEDMLRIYEENAEPVFIFSRDNEQSTYKLTLEAGGRPVKMKQGSTDIICVSPCVIRDGNGILFVSDIEGSKLKPFISREFIQIPKKTEVKYFGSFVLNAINNYRVSGSGFKIIEYSPPREALLSLETGISGDPMLILQFNYDSNKVYHGDQQIAFTQLESTGEQFVFRKFYRDMEWERNCIERLEQLGYYSDDNINFTIDSPGNRESDKLYSVVESVNRNFPEITDAGFILRSRLTENYNLHPVGLELSSRLENDWFDLRAVVKIGEWEFPFTRLRKNILNGIRVYELPDGSKAVLPETWFARYKNLFEFGKSKDDSLRIHKQHFSLLADTISDEGNQLLEKLERLLIPENLAIPDAPSGLKCEMRHYQSEGLAWLHFLQRAGLGGCLADDMGLGKTIQALALLQHNKENMNTVQDQAGELTLFGRERGMEGDKGKDRTDSFSRYFSQ